LAASRGSSRLYATPGKQSTVLYGQASTVAKLFDCAAAAGMPAAKAAASCK
jgi:hypothetical protein